MAFYPLGTLVPSAPPPQMRPVPPSEWAQYGLVPPAATPTAPPMPASSGAVPPLPPGVVPQVGMSPTYDPSVDARQFYGDGAFNISNFNPQQAIKDMQEQYFPQQPQNDMATATNAPQQTPQQPIQQKNPFDEFIDEQKAKAGKNWSPAQYDSLTDQFKRVILPQLLDQRGETENAKTVENLLDKHAEARRLAEFGDTHDEGGFINTSFATAKQALAGLGELAGGAEKFLASSPTMGADLGRAATKYIADKLGYTLPANSPADKVLDLAHTVEGYLGAPGDWLYNQSRKFSDSSQTRAEKEAIYNQAQDAADLGGGFAGNLQAYLENPLSMLPGGANLAGQVILPELAVGKALTIAGRASRAADAYKIDPVVAKLQQADQIAADGLKTAYKSGDPARIAAAEKLAQSTSQALSNSDAANALVKSTMSGQRLPLSRLAQSIVSDPEKMKLLNAGLMGAGFGGQAGIDTENYYNTAPLTTILQNPSNKALFDSIKLIGLDDKQAEAKLRQTLGEQNAPIAEAGGFAGNILGAYAIPGGGIAGSLARRTAAKAGNEAAASGSNALMRMLKGAASAEGANALMTGVQTGATNIATGQPVTQGMGQQLAAGVVPAGVLGALGGYGEQRSATQQKPDDTTKATGTRGLQGKKGTSATDNKNPPNGGGGANIPVGTSEVPGITASTAYNSPASRPMADEQFTKLSEDWEKQLPSLGPKIKNSISSGTIKDILQKAVVTTATRLKDVWPSLSNAQRLDLVEKTVAQFNAVKGKGGIRELDNEGNETNTLNNEFIAHKQRLLPEAQPNTNEAKPVANQAQPTANAPLTETGQPSNEAATAIAGEQKPSPQKTMKGGKASKQTAITTMDADKVQEELAAIKQLKEKHSLDQEAIDKIPVGERAAKLKELDAAAAKPKESKAPETKPSGKQAYLNNWIMYLLGKDDLVSPTYKEEIERDPEVLKKMKSAYEADKEKGISPEWVEENLRKINSELAGGEVKPVQKAPETPAQPTQLTKAQKERENTQLRTLLQKSKSWSNSGEKGRAKEEVKRIATGLKEYGEVGKDGELSKSVLDMTLSDARDYLAKIEKAGLRTKKSAAENTAPAKTETKAPAKTEAEKKQGKKAKAAKQDHGGQLTLNGKKISLKQAKEELARKEAEEKKAAEAKAQTPEPKKSGVHDRLKNKIEAAAEKSTKKEAPPPKQEAPAQEKAGAAEKNETQETPQSPKQTLREKLENSFPELGPQDIDSLHQAIEFAQDGEPEFLTEEINGLIKDGKLDRGDREVLNKLAKEPAEDARQDLRDSIESASKEASAITEEMRLRMESEDKYGGAPSNSKTPPHVRERGEYAIDRIHDGDMSPEELASEVDRAVEDSKKRHSGNLSKRDKNRGIDEVRKRLLELKDSMKGDTQKRAVDFALWLLEKNPNIAKRMSLVVSDKDALGRENSDKTGQYDVVNDVVHIIKSEYHFRTIVHEILHRAERLLPEDIQNRIKTEYYSRLLNKYKQIQRLEATTPKAEAFKKDALGYLDAVIRNLFSPTESNRRAALDYILKGKVNADAFYRYFDPSEYWAEEGARILKQKHSATSWVAKAKEWMTEFVAHLKALVGMSTESAVYKGLKEVLSTEGEQKSKNMLARNDAPNSIHSDTPEDDEESIFEEPEPTDEEAKTELKAERAEIKARVKGVVGAAQPIIENLAQSGYGLEQSVVDINKAGGEVNEDTDPMLAQRDYHSQTDWINKKDYDTLVRPYNDWITNNWSNFADSEEHFRDAINDFFGYKNLTERYHYDYLEKVPLKEGMDVVRDDLLEDLAARKISPESFNTRLEKLVAEHADMDEGHYVTTLGGVSEEAYAHVYDMLKELKEGGIDEESMAELNEILDPIREQLIDHAKKGMGVPEDDPYIKAYNFKWYVPLKAAPNRATGPAAAAAFDLVPTKYISLGRITKQLEIMKGRNSIGQRPLDRLIVDLSRGGERVANNNMLGRMYEYVVDNAKLMGAKITVYKGGPKDGYYDVTDKDRTILPRLPKPGIGFIWHDGDTHYSVTLPKDSQLMRGLMLMNEYTPPGMFTRGFGKVTNFMAKGYTVMNPMWSIAAGFVRSMSGIPLSVAMQEFRNPVNAGRYLYHFTTEFMSNALPAMRTFMATAAQLTYGEGKKIGGFYVKSMEQLAETNPYARKFLEYEENGGAFSHAKMYSINAVNKLGSSSLSAKLSNIFHADSYKKAADGVLDLTVKHPYTVVTDYLSNFTKALEAVSRVSSFEALKDIGYSERKAAITTRSVVDYAQAGLYGKTLNSYFAFFKIGMSTVDQMRRSFRDLQTGKFDAVKFGLWMATMSAVGALTYSVNAAIMGKDDDGKDNIKKLRADTLTQKLLMPMGNTDSPYAAAIGLGLPQVMLAPGTLAAAVANGHITMGEAADELLHTVLRNGPVRLAGTTDSTPSASVASLWLGMTIPTAMAPQVALWGNKNSFDSPIHTTHPKPGLPAYAQGYSTTPEEFKDIAKQMYDLTGGTVNYYPEDIRFLLQNYGGQVASDLVKMTIDKANHMRIGDDAQFNPITSRFQVNDAKYYDSEHYNKVTEAAGDILVRYNVVGDEARQASGGNKAAAQMARQQFLAENPEYRPVVRASLDLAKAEEKRSTTIKALRTSLASDMRKQLLRKQADSEFRKAIDNLETAVNRYNSQK